MTTTATHLRTIATLWPALADALGTPTQSSWPPVTLRAYLAGLEQLDADEVEARHHQAMALRTVEREQLSQRIGEHPLLISARVHDVRVAVSAALLDLADQIADRNQRRPLTVDSGRGWSDPIHREAALLAARDNADPQRWLHLGGPRHTAPYAALWLCARWEGIPAPCRPLNAQQRDRIATVAAGAVTRIEQVLDMADGHRMLDTSHPCACGGQIEVYGGAGATPVARCTKCGLIWTESGVIAA